MCVPWIRGWVMSPIRVIAVLVLLGIGGCAQAKMAEPGSAGTTTTLPVSPGKLKATFLGVSTVLFDDGETAILTDGFFSRPGPLKLLFGRIEPDRKVVAAHVDRAGIRKLAAVIVNHSHYDHAMDAPEVARLTGAKLVGSASTANVGRGWGLPEDQIQVAKPGEAMRFGQFEIRMLRSDHAPSGVSPPGEITTPLRPPVSARDYLEGGSHSVVINHAGRTMVMNASAGFIAGKLKDVRADVVFLGIGMLSRQDPAYQEDYWREVVTTVGARRVIVVHWDNFTVPLDQPMVQMPSLIDDVDATMRFLTEHGEKDHVDVRLPVAWQPFDPFADLPPR